ncbi:MAG: GAF and HD-GYP domain-containing protein, partial [Planctomycetota bacterium]
LPISSIGLALSREKDREKLLREILTRVRQLTNSDGGALFVVAVKPGVVEDEDNYLSNKQLIFKIVQNDSLPVVEKDFVEKTLEITENSLVGYSAIHQEVLNIPDAYQIDVRAPYGHDVSWDKRNNYRTRSMLVVPMVGTKGETLGVIELLNRKKERGESLGSVFATGSQVVAFDAGTQAFAESLACQAAIALENVNLYANIEKLFEGFIHASVRAIEARDPTTSGHSERVAKMTIALAEAAGKADSGPFKNLVITRQTLKEIEYASLLHDFGKISVPEEVLIKAKKLYPRDLRHLEDRIRLLRSELKLMAAEKKLDRLKGGQSIEDIEAELQAALEELEHFSELAHKSNEPTVLEEGDFQGLERFRGRCLEAHCGPPIPYLNEDEFLSLSLKRGTLTDEQRRQIESHVTHTFNFLHKIPWTQELRHVSKIAHAHHEKLSGKGYPLGLKGDAIPIQSRMMAIADIFDALTARDRPYKRAVPLDKSLEILQSEVARGDLDGHLFMLFRDQRVYRSAGIGE